MADDVSPPPDGIRRDRPHWGQCPEPLIYDTQVSAQAKVVYLALDRHADQRGACFPGQDRLAEMLGVSRRTVTRAVAELKDSGWLTIDRRRNNSNLYTVLTSGSATGVHLDETDLSSPDLDGTPVSSLVETWVAPEPEPEEPEPAKPPQPPRGGSDPVGAKIVAGALILIGEEIDRRTDLHNPGGYRRSRLPAVIAENDPTWRLLLEVEPDMTAQQLVDSSRPAHHFQSSPLDATVAAQGQRLEDWTGRGQGYDRHPQFVEGDD